MSPLAMAFELTHKVVSIAWTALLRVVGAVLVSGTENRDFERLSPEERSLTFSRAEKLAHDAVFIASRVSPSGSLRRFYVNVLQDAVLVALHLERFHGHSHSMQRVLRFIGRTLMTEYMDWMPMDKLSVGCGTRSMMHGRAQDWDAFGSGVANLLMIEKFAQAAKSEDK